MIKTGDKIKNFTVTRVRESNELSGRLVELKHDKVGTEVVWVDNGDQNKLFSIAFKTLPSDSTGVFHILEHSVLCGSEKYPVKEPFVDLLKSSMNTFLNALTFQDKTMYPVSSRNEKDYLNLSSVYLDAVFAPAILKNKNIFYQEGWHIEQGDKLSYKGVVFNEMKGAMASKDELIIESMLALLFRDNCYGFNSGGDPEVIPSLTYEKFIEVYKKHYHPSNARVFLDGSVPLEATLELLDSYCSKYEKSEDLPVLSYQKPVSGEETIYYALSEEEDLKDKAQLTMAKIIGRWDEPVRNMAVAVLFNALSDSNDAPFAKALLKSNLAQDLDMVVNDEAAQVFASIEVKNITDGKEQEVIDAIKNVAKEQCENGIDRKALIASINALEYKLKAPDEPAGLLRAMRSHLSWLYGGDPLMYLECDAYFAKLREYLDTDEYEKLLKEVILNDEGMCILKALPSYTASKEKDENEAKRLEVIKASWSEKDFADNKALNEELLSWQQTEDSKEASDTIPMLKLSDVSPEIDFTETIETSLKGARVLYHPLHTNGLVHFNMYFSLTNRSLGELKQLSVLGQLLSYLPTKNYTTLELEQEIKTYLGNLSFAVSVFSKREDFVTATPVLVVTCSCLKENLSHAYELIYEVLSSTKFEKDEVLNLLQQNDIRARQAAIVGGQFIGRLVTMSHYSAEATVAEVLGGYSAIMWSHELVEKFDDLSDDFISLVSSTLERACARKRMTVSYVNDNELDFTGLISKFEEGGSISESTAYHPFLPKNVTMKIPAQVGFAVQGMSLQSIDKEYEGSMSVAANILTLDYLWNKVRVQGGAYGTGLKIGLAGGMTTYSYRDPNLKDSIEVNKGAGDHLRKLCSDKVDIDKYIISAIAATEPLLPPSLKLSLADRDYLCGTTKEDILRQRRQMLDTKYDDLLKVADIVDQFAKEGSLCIIGPEEKVSEFTNCDRLEL